MIQGKTNKTNATEAMMSKYRFLFHKYRINRDHSELRYEVKEELVKEKKIAAHLHCYNLSNFRTFYDDSITDRIDRHADILVTYTVGAGGMGGLLEIPNKGMDVGAKFCAVHYLAGRGYEYVLFLHSKTDPAMRVRFYEWYLNQLPLLAAHLTSRDQRLRNEDDFFPVRRRHGGGGGSRHHQKKRRRKRKRPMIGGIFDPYMVVRQRNWPKNRNNLMDLIGYLGLEDDYFSFPIGNVFILSMDMAEFLYMDPLLYSVLNTPTSLDFGWFVEYYKGHLNKRNFQKLLDGVRNGETAMNNLHLGTGHDGLADSMIEHAFERIVFLALRKHSKVGVFDLATTSEPWIEVYATAGNETKARENSNPRSPLPRMRDLEAKYFAKTQTRHDRMIFITSRSYDAMQRGFWNNIIFLAKVATHIIVLLDDEADRLDLVASSILTWYRDVIIVDDVLTDRQCRLYSENFVLEQDLRAWSNDQLRYHFFTDFPKNKRFTPKTVVTVHFVSEIQHFATQDSKADFNDFLLFNRSDNLLLAYNHSNPQRLIDSRILHRYATISDLSADVSNQKRASPPPAAAAANVDDIPDGTMDLARFDHYGSLYVPEALDDLVERTLDNELLVRHRPSFAPGPLQYVDFR